MFRSFFAEKVFWWNVLLELFGYVEGEGFEVFVENIVCWVFDVGVVWVLDGKIVERWVGVMEEEGEGVVDLLVAVGVVVVRGVCFVW